ncbi:MAG: hypothetical protein GKR95_20450 [Gammaproteobacteria bacterium]|nr:hypothetical protein [Gammaproteobacteria bacterium]NKB64380.1 hypothetical protein [Gammaproteobacteria bacterium]
MKNLIIIIAFQIMLSGCVSVEQRKKNIESDIAELYSAHLSAEIQEFFVEESVNAGVKAIRAMKPSDVLPPTNEYEMVGCAYGFKNSKLILIEVSRPNCITPSVLAHEISHIGANCSAHNDHFYKYNWKIAERYQNRFPDATKRKWFAPVQSVGNISAIYRSEGC